MLNSLIDLLIAHYHVASNVSFFDNLRMNFVHFKMGTISSKHADGSSGRSVIAAAAYRMGLCLSENVVVDGVVTTLPPYDYSKKADVIAIGILAPEGSPEWVYDAQTLWQKFTDHERGIRKDARVAGDIVLALPNEFSLDANKRLVEKFIEEEVVGRGLIASYGLHGDEGNVHAHVMTTLRPIVDGKFGARTKEMNKRSMPKTLRKAWVGYVNEAYEKHGYYTRVTEKSYRDLGIDLLPTMHEGYAARKLAEMGENVNVIKGNFAIKERNVRVMIEKPSVFIQRMQSKYSIFTDRNIEQELYKITVNSSYSFEEIGINLRDKIYQEESLSVMKMEDGRYNSDAYVFAKNSKINREINDTDIIHDSSKDSVEISKDTVANDDKNIGEKKAKESILSLPEAKLIFSKNVKKLAQEIENKSVLHTDKIEEKQEDNQSGSGSHIKLVSKQREHFDKDEILEHLQRSAASIFASETHENGKPWNLKAKGSGWVSQDGKLEIYRGSVVFHKPLKQLLPGMKDGRSMGLLAYWAAKNGYNINVEFTTVLEALGRELGLAKQYWTENTREKISLAKPIENSSKKAPEEIQSDRQKAMWAEIHRASIEIFKGASIDHPVKQYLLKNRGLSLEVIDNLELGIVNDRAKLYEHLTRQGFNKEDFVSVVGNEIGKSARGWGIGETHNMLIPCYDDMGESIGVIARNIAWSEEQKLGKYLFSRGMKKSQVLYGMEKVQGEHLTIVEGQMDVQVMHAYGIGNVVALGGSALSNAQLELLERKGIKQVTLCLDGDEAGEVATKTLALQLIEKGISIDVVRLSSAKDPGEYIQAYGDTVLLTEEMMHTISAGRYLSKLVEQGQKELLPRLLVLEDKFSDADKQLITPLINKHLIRDDVIDQGIYEASKSTNNVIDLSTMRKQYDLDKIAKELENNHHKYFKKQEFKVDPKNNTWTSKDGTLTMLNGMINTVGTRKQEKIIHYWLKQEGKTFVEGINHLAKEIGLEREYIKPKISTANDKHIEIMNDIHHYSRLTFLSLEDSHPLKIEVKNYLRAQIGEGEIKNNIEVGVIDNRRKLFSCLSDVKGWDERDVKELLPGNIGYSHKLVIPARTVDEKAAGLYACNIAPMEGQYTGVVRSRNKPVMLHRLDKVEGKEAILIKDVMTAVVMHAKGIDNVIALDWNEISDSQINLLKQKDIRKVTLGFDTDKAAIEKAILKLSRHDIEVEVLRNNNVLQAVRENSLEKGLSTIGGIEWLHKSLAKLEKQEILTKVYGYEKDLQVEDRRELRILCSSYGLPVHMDIGAEVSDDQLRIAKRLAKQIDKAEQSPVIEEEVKNQVEWLVKENGAVKYYNIDKEVGDHIVQIADNWYVEKKAIYTQGIEILKSLPKKQIDTARAEEIIAKVNEIVHPVAPGDPIDNHIRIMFEKDGQNYGYDIDKTAAYIARDTVNVQIKGLIGEELGEAFAESLENHLIAEFAPYYHDVEQIIAKITRTQTVFRENELQTAVMMAVRAKDDQLDKVTVLGVIEEAVKAGMLTELARADLSGRKYYTTHAQIELEKDAIACVDKLQAQDSYELISDNLHSFVESTQLNKKQKEAALHILESNDIAVIEGRPGTGKTTMLKIVKEYADEYGKGNIHGIAAYGIAEHTLEKETGISSCTVESWKLKEAKNLQKGDMLIVDEAGLVSSSDMNWLVQHTQSTGAKLVLIGDVYQTQPIAGGQSFGMIRDHVGSVVLDEIMRQKKPWQREASNNLSEGNFREALQAYHDNGRVIHNDMVGHLHHQLVKDYLNERNGDKVVIAYTNKEVNTLNRMIRNEYIKSGKIKDIGEKFGIGEEIIFKENIYKADIDVRNGMRGVVREFIPGQEEIRQGDKIIQEKIDNHFVIEIEGREVAISEAVQMKTGYATTIDSCQGTTKNKVFVMINALMDGPRSLVALTRHRDDMKLYTIENNIVDLADKIGRSGVKLNALDLADSHETLYEKDQAYVNVYDYVETKKQLRMQAGLLKNKEQNSLSISLHGPEVEQFNKLQEQKDHLTDEIVNNFSNSRKYLQEAGIKAEEITNVIHIPEITQEEKQNIADYATSKHPELADTIMRGMVGSHMVKQQFKIDAVSFYHKELDKHGIDINDLANDAKLFNATNLPGEYVVHEKRWFGTKGIGDLKQMESFLVFANKVKQAKIKYDGLGEKIEKHEELIKKQEKVVATVKDKKEKEKAVVDLEALQNNKNYQKSQAEKKELQKYIGRFSRKEDYTHLLNIAGKVSTIKNKYQTIDASIDLREKAYNNAMKTSIKIDDLPAEQRKKSINNLTNAWRKPGKNVDEALYYEYLMQLKMSAKYLIHNNIAIPGYSFTVLKKSMAISLEKKEEKIHEKIEDQNTLVIDSIKQHDKIKQEFYSYLKESYEDDKHHMSNMVSNEEVDKLDHYLSNREIQGKKRMFGLVVDQEYKDSLNKHNIIVAYADQLRQTKENKEKLLFDDYKNTKLGTLENSNAIKNKLKILNNLDGEILEKVTDNIVEYQRHENRHLSEDVISNLIQVTHDEANIEGREWKNYINADDNTPEDITDRLLVKRRIKHMAMIQARKKQMTREQHKLHLQQQEREAQKKVEMLASEFSPKAQEFFKHQFVSYLIKHEGMPHMRTEKNILNATVRFEERSEQHAQWMIKQKANNPHMHAHMYSHAMFMEHNFHESHEYLRQLEHKNLNASKYTYTEYAQKTISKTIHHDYDLGRACYEPHKVQEEIKQKELNLDRGFSR